MAINPEAAILATWRKNANCWTVAVRQRQIESRQRVTDAAVLEAVLSCSGQTVLDLGCGEGWLTRSLTAQGRQVLGVDAVAELVQQANALGGGTFAQMDYGAIATQASDGIAAGDLQQSFDIVVCNFSLFGQASVEQLLGAVPGLLNPDGSCVIQTLHPQSACGNLPYEDGWRAGSWQGFSEAFVDPAPWYFRTVESWVALLKRSGFDSIELQTARDSDSGQAASLLLVAQV